MRRIFDRLDLAAWRRVLVLVVLVGPFVGCDVGGPNDLVIACSWPERERSKVEADFRSWLEQFGDPTSVTRLHWVGLDPSRDPAAASPLDPRPDVLLGGPCAPYRVWAERGAIEDEGLGWFVVRRRTFGLDLGGPYGDPDEPFTLDELAGPAFSGRLALADPRTDPAALVLAAEYLRVSSWNEGFAALAGLYENAAQVSRGDPVSLVERGRANAAIVPGGADGSISPPITYEEGAAMVREVDHPEPARAFFRFLRERRPEVESTPLAFKPEALSLLADLLGSTLVDPHHERHASPGPRASDLLPRWPPQGIAALRAREEGEDLVRLSAEELVGDDEARAWLLRSWQRPGVVDGDLLNDLARAAGGRLVREPRFRAWLRAEWTESARSRRRQAEAPRR
jgi:hypothetical protein